MKTENRVETLENRTFVLYWANCALLDNIPQDSQDTKALTFCGLAPYGILIVCEKETQWTDRPTRAMVLLEATAISMCYSIESHVIAKKIPIRTAIKWYNNRGKSWTIVRPSMR